VTTCTCDPLPWSRTDPEPTPDEDCPVHGNPKITGTTVSLLDTHWETLLTTARLHAYREVRQMPNVTTPQCQQIAAAAVAGVRQQIEEWAAQQAANRSAEK
jgi:hypothetical protein